MQPRSASVWIALSRLLPRRRLVPVMERWPDPDAAWAAGEADLAEAALRQERVAAAAAGPDGAAEWLAARRDELARSLTSSRRRLAAEAEAVCDELARSGARVLAYADAAFPPILRYIPDPPAILYLRGPLTLGDGKAVALIGARRANGYGVAVAERLAGELARAGVTVVSGMAMGIDAAAHRGALAAAGRTIAVLGSGIDVPYPRSGAALYQRICAAGAVVSEHPPGTPALPHQFPERNRLISGLSHAVVVVQAALGSGSLHTVEAAGEQGRDVAAVPGPVDSPLSEYPHQLIRDGARLAASATDVLEMLGVHGPGPGKAPAGRPPDQQALLLQLRGAPCSADELSIAAGLPPHRVAAALTALELAGLVRTLPDGRFTSG